LRLEVCREIPTSERLRREWNRLVSEMETAEVFYTYEWALSVARAYRGSVTPLLVLAWDDDRLAGVASLATGGRQDTAFFLSGFTADYCDFLSRPRDRSTFTDLVLGKVREIGISDIALANLPKDSASARALRVESRRCGYHHFQRHAYWCAQVRMDSEPERARVKAQASARKTVRRCFNSLAKRGAVDFCNCHGRDAVSAAFGSFSRMHVARFLDTGRISNLCRPERRDFLKELAHQFSESSAVTLSQLTVGDRPIAWNFGFQFGGSWFWYQPTFDSRWERDSPGLCLLAKILITASDRPDIRVVDLGLGAEGYKERFATSMRETLHVTLSRDVRHYAREAARHHLATAVKKLPALEGWSRAVRSKVQDQANTLASKGWRSYGSDLARRIRRRCFGEELVLLYRWPLRTVQGDPCRGRLQALDLDLLANAAMEHADDPETLAYLLRAAARLRSDRSQGFALVNGSGHPVHFCWATPFHDFNMAELGTSISLAADTATVIFDCWTPQACRGHGFYPEAIQRVCEALVSEGRVPWIFSAAQNEASIRGIEKAGFERDSSLVQKKAFFLRKRNVRIGMDLPVTAIDIKASS
jgi:CelD/BcsL family acetyltransferase involved in cellulose biosynthesis/RimJ/RimL family protein N-acetyltransferase